MTNLPPCSGCSLNLATVMWVTLFGETRSQVKEISES